MTPVIFSRFAVCLEYLPHGTAPEWDAGCVRFYSAVLNDIPDTACDLLMKAVGTQFKFRPTPHDILEVWAKISLPPPALAEEVAGRMLLLRRQKGPQSRRIPGDPCCRWEHCEPNWTDPVMGRVSYMMGGWTAFCNEDTSLSYLRHHLVQVCAAVIGGAGDAAIAALRLEYMESRPQTPLLETPLLSAPPEGGALSGDRSLAEIGRGEAAQLMASLSKSLPVRLGGF